MSKEGVIDAREIQSPDPKLRLIGLRAVMRMTDRSRSSLYRDVELGRFPAPVRTGEKSRAWYLHEVEDWIRERPRITESAG